MFVARTANSHVREAGARPEVDHFDDAIYRGERRLGKNACSLSGPGHCGRIPGPSRAAEETVLPLPRGYESDI